MTDRDQLSRLPGDSDYWDRLEARVVASIAGEHRATGWWAPVAGRAWQLAGVGLAAGIALALLIPPRPAASTPPTIEVLGASTDSPTLRQFMAAHEPPALAELLMPGTEAPDE